MRLLPLLCAWLAAATALRAQSPVPSLSPAPARPRVILFVGNSFTFGGSQPVQGYNAAAIVDENAGQHPMGGIPGIFKKLADEAGRPYEVHIELVGGKDLEYHYTHALPLITSGKWDAVVLQGYSTEPVPAERGGKRDNFIKYAALLTRSIHEANPATKIYFYETWPRADLAYPENKPYHDHGEVAAMAEDLRVGYQLAGGSEEVIGVGEVWRKAINDGTAQANPYLPPEPGKLDLWGKDHYHPSIYGSYLAALVLFGNIADIDVLTMNPQEGAAHDLGISPADAAKLRREARVSVMENHRPPAEQSRRPH